MTDNQKTDVAVVYGYELGYNEAVREHDAEVARLTAALKVCEEALHCAAILRDDPLEPAGDHILYAAQQASGAYMTSWQPGQQEHDDAGGTDG